MSYQIYDAKNNWFEDGEFMEYEDADEHRSWLLTKDDYAGHKRSDLPILLNCEDSIPYTVLCANRNQYWKKLLDINTVVDGDGLVADKIDAIKKILLRWN